MADRKIAVLTGASSGIGRAAAIGFAQAGYAIVVCGRRVDALYETVAMSGASAADSLAFACDVTEPSAVAALFEAAIEKFGRVDVVFNNAGRGSAPATIGDTSIDVWHEVVAVNLNGAFYVAREAFRTMRAQSPQGGRIINNGSISAFVPRPHSVPYNATKNAISGLTKSISLDGRPFDIACGQIDIGNAATDMTARMNDGVMQANGEKAVEPRMDVRHVADAVVYMANLPLEANVQTMTVMATKMPYIGRG
jgi:NAD(P)-dependent dehydrogenase (short-subunit alcohol dehydrogenase family)